MTPAHTQQRATGLQIRFEARSQFVQTTPPGAFPKRNHHRQHHRIQYSAEAINTMVSTGAFTLAGAHCLGVADRSRTTMGAIACSIFGRVIAPMARAAVHFPVAASIAANGQPDINPETERRADRSR
jgi:hypothetical protein